MKKQSLLCLLFFIVVNSWSQSDTVQKITPGRFNSAEQQQKPYVIMISSDGFRFDYAEKYHAKNLLRLSAHGISAASMIPSYPSLTFPNHYTLVTGLYPSHHGLANNYFYDWGRKLSYSMHGATVTDGSWYGGTPLWVLAEQQHMLTASYFWVGSEADIKGVRPTYYYKFSDSIPIDRRI
jgi:predicted AlkP superfamily pyrophosphatase or phosphodiesterase